MSSHIHHYRWHDVLAQFYDAQTGASECLAARLIGGTRPFVCAVLAAQGVSPDDRDDLCQDTCLRLLDALRKSRLPGAIRIESWSAYARRAACNCATDYVRRQQRTPQALSMQEMEARSEADPEALQPVDPENVENRAVCGVYCRECIWPLVCELPPRQRAALLLAMQMDELLLLAHRLSEVARALEMSLAEFLLLRKALPLPDAQIALRLNVIGSGKTSAEYRVSNLRKCARERIARHARDINDPLRSEKDWVPGTI